MAPVGNVPLVLSQGVAAQFTSIAAGTPVTVVNQTKSVVLVSFSQAAANGGVTAMNIPYNGSLTVSNVADYWFYSQVGGMLTATDPFSLRGNLPPGSIAPPPPNNPLEPWSYTPLSAYIVGQLVPYNGVWYENLTGSNSISPLTPATDTVNWGIYYLNTSGEENTAALSFLDTPANATSSVIFSAINSALITLNSLITANGKGGSPSFPNVVIGTGLTGVPPAVQTITFAVPVNMTLVGSPSQAIVRMLVSNSSANYTNEMVYGADFTAVLSGSPNTGQTLTVTTIPSSQNTAIPAGSVVQLEFFTVNAGTVGAFSLQVYNTSGTYTVQAGVTSVLIGFKGAAAGGCSGSGLTAIGQAGGGGAAEARGWLTVSEGDSIAWSLGTPGAGGVTAVGAPNKGGDSTASTLSLNSNVLLTMNAVIGSSGSNPSVGGTYTISSAGTAAGITASTWLLANGQSSTAGFNAGPLCKYSGR